MLQPPWQQVELACQRRHPQTKDHFDAGSASRVGLPTGRCNSLAVWMAWPSASGSRNCHHHRSVATLTTSVWCGARWRPTSLNATTPSGTNMANGATPAVYNHQRRARCVPAARLRRKRPVMAGASTPTVRTNSALPPSTETQASGASSRACVPAGSYRWPPVLKAMAARRTTVAGAASAAVALPNAVALAVVLTLRRLAAARAAAATRPSLAHLRATRRSRASPRRA